MNQSYYDKYEMEITQVIKLGEWQQTHNLMLVVSEQLNAIHGPSVHPYVRLAIYFFE